jgi:hypothetical protein
MDQRTAQAATKWITEKCPELKCPACGRADWSGAAIGYGSLAATPIEGTLKPLPPPLPDSLPLLYLFCKHCAYALSFSALEMGLTPWKKSDEQ